MKRNWLSCKGVMKLTEPKTLDWKKSEDALSNI